MAEVIQAKPNADTAGNTRITLDEGYTGKVRVGLTGFTASVDVFNAATGEFTQRSGDPIDGYDHFLGGQREFFVHPTTTSLTFDDGTSWTSTDTAVSNG